MSELTYPLAEVFYSLQGEGVYTGTPMTFVRLAGCNVGRPLPSSHELFPKYTRCGAVSGPSFICDTNYIRTDIWSVEKIVEYVGKQPAKIVCLTGGEPLLHPLEPLVEALHSIDKECNIETSGTKPIPHHLFDWVTCSPKVGFLKQNVGVPDEYKFLIGPDTHLEVLEGWMEDVFGRFLAGRGDPQVYLQPVNHLHSIDSRSVQRCYEFLSKHPEWSLSIQMHKVLGVR